MKKSMKKILAVIMAVVVVGACFVGCGKQDAQSTSGSGKKYTIGICQLVQHDALDTATKGFKDALVEKLGADNVTFEEQNASGDSNTCNTICGTFVSNNVDLIMANATPALQAATTATTTIPIVATSVTDYGSALDMELKDGATGINVTGTADLAPLDKQAQMVKDLVPDAKNVAILYCSAESNSKFQAQVVAEALSAIGISSKEYTAADSNELTSVVQSIVNDKCDAVYIPTDNTIASSAELVNNILEPAKIPVIAGEEGICKDCGIATLSISYYNLGYQAGVMAAQILMDGKDPATMPIATDSAPVMKYMPERAAALGITVPDTYEAIVSE